MTDALVKVDEQSEDVASDVNNEPEKVNSEETQIQKISECENEDKMDTASIQERRVSQNSELNNDPRDSTPMQTDNEEVTNFSFFQKRTIL